MANIRGSALIPRVAWLKQRHAQHWEAILSGVQPATCETLEAHPIATGWYPFEQFVDLMLVADRVAGNGDMELIRALGHHAATANLSTILRVFLRFGSPEYILGKAAKVWSLYHDTGRGESEPLGPRSLAFSVYEHGAPHKALCVTLLGWTRAYLEAAGCKSVKVVETKCRLSGGDCCRFDAGWE
jgi:Protein of unknown function (DUF2378)